MSLIFAGPYDTLAGPGTQRGFGTSFCQRQTGRWSPTAGWTFDQDFRGLSLATMQNLANLYANGGVEYELTYQNGIASLKTTDSTGNITIDIWEISSNIMSRSLFLNPLWISALSANDIKVIARASIDGTDLASAAAKLTADESTGADPVTYTVPDVTGTTAAGRLWNRTKNQSDLEYWADAYTLRHTTNASNRGYYNVADSNVNCIYTQSQFYSEITNGSNWIFPAPNEIIGALNSIFAGLPTPPSNYLKGALKGGSSRVTAARNRVNIVTEYKIYDWTSDDYSLAS